MTDGEGDAKGTRPAESLNAARIRQAFLSIPGLSQNEDARKLRDLIIDQIVHDLSWRWGGDYPVTTRRDYPEAPDELIDLFNIRYGLNKKENQTRAATLRQIDAFKKQSIKLMQVLANLDCPARNAIQPSGKTPGLPDIPKLDVLFQLLNLMTLTAIHINPEDIPDAPQSGRPKEKVAAEIADATAQHFLFFTGSRPTIVTYDGRAGGAFMDVLRVVFQETGVTASVESQARAACERLRAAVAGKEKTTPKKSGFSRGK